VRYLLHASQRKFHNVIGKCSAVLRVIEVEIRPQPLQHWWRLQVVQHLTDYTMYTPASTRVIRTRTNDVAYQNAKPQVVGRHRLGDAIERWRGMGHLVRHDAGHP
jgi:hypothetical protein